MKKLANLKGVKALSKMEQKLVLGGNRGYCILGFCNTTGEPCSGDGEVCESQYIL